VSRVQRPRVAVFCRAPVPGRAKTRLSPEFTPDQAAALALAMLLDVVNALADRRWTLGAEAARDEDLAAVRALMPPGVGVGRQCDGDLGARMRAGLERRLAEGAPAAVIVGSDCPEIRRRDVAAALAALASGADAALSPAGDGGYALIAARTPVAPLFSGISWSTSKVLDQTRERAREAGIALAEVGPVHDVDRPEDVRRLVGNRRRASPVARRSRAVALAGVGR
jgi:rSAM/selenodomain-associated transferase 1